MYYFSFGRSNHKRRSIATERVEKSYILSNCRHNRGHLYIVVEHMISYPVYIACPMPTAMFLFVIEFHSLRSSFVLGLPKPTDPPKRQQSKVKFNVQSTLFVHLIFHLQ